MGGGDDGGSTNGDKSLRDRRSQNFTGSVSKYSKIKERQQLFINSKAANSGAIMQSESNPREQT